MCRHRQLTDDIRYTSSEIAGGVRGHPLDSVGLTFGNIWDASVEADAFDRETDIVI
jgi:hypothetical protein